MEPEIEKPAFTPDELHLIQQQFEAAGVMEPPSENQLQSIREFLNQNNSLGDLDIFIKEKIQVKIKQQDSLQKPAINNKSSMFKQFAESKIQEEHPSLEYICKSKRKIKPTQPFQRLPLEQAVQGWDGNTLECTAMFQKRGRKGFGGPPTCTLNESCCWNFYEHFYSSVDRNFLKQEPMRRLLNQMDFIPQRMTYYEHRMIKQALPAPKSFGPEFLSSQLARLSEYMTQNRMISKQKGREPELNVGKEVIVLHPVCGHLHTGSIMAIYKENQLLVKFQKPQLGTHKVLDTLMSSREMSSQQKIIIENIDYEVMAMAIRLLEYKTDLLRFLKEYNSLAQSIQKSEGILDNVFFQEYGWIGSTINILNLGIKQVISRFRFRGITKENQEKIGKNFPSFLINPLNLMQKELKKSNDSSDNEARSQINDIISNYKENRTELLAKELYSKVATKIERSELNSDQQQEMEKILKSMIGLLVNLRHQCRNFSLGDNKYLNELMNVIDTRYPQHFNQIYETLHSITAKVSEEVK